MTNFCEKYVDEILISDYKHRNDFDYFSTQNVYVEEYENAIVLPSKSFKGEFFPRAGVLNPKTLELLDISKIYPNRCVLGYEFSFDDVINDDREVIYAGSFWWHWGHFILEQVSRLYYFLSDNSTMPIIYTAPSPLDGPYLEFFELLGIDTTRLVWVNNITRFKKVIIPSVSVCATQWYTKEYQLIYQKIKDKIEPDKEEKIFFSTKNFSKSWKKDRGQSEKIEQLFVDNGFKVYYPEKLSLKKQIALLKGARHFASFAGTLPHNLLFADKLDCAVILNKSFILNFHQSLINQVTGIAPIYIDTHLSILPQTIGSGPFFYVVNDNLLNFAKDSNMLIRKSIRSLSVEEIRDFCKGWLEFYLRCLENNNFAPHCMPFLLNNYKFYLKRLDGFGVLKLFVCLFYKLKLYQTPIVGFRRCVLIFLTKALLKLNDFVN